jgi:hypothetical protein
MLNSTILLKVKQRLNKLASNDYDNILEWQIIEAFNKGQSDWVRRTLHGLNSVKEGDESTNRRIDDLQILLNTVNILMVNAGTYYESATLPLDYLQYKRISTEASTDCCKDKTMVVYLSEQQNTDILLRDNNKKPSFTWGETFATFKNNKFQIYTNNEFTINNTKLTYYRQPTKILIAGIQDPYDVNAPVPLIDTPCEFKDDVVEVLIDECSKIIAGDIESIIQQQREAQAVESNN